MEKKTQKDKIFEYLKAGNSITPIEALERFGCFRLAAVIWKIRQEKHVYTTMVKNKHGYSFAKYSLIPFNQNWKSSMITSIGYRGES